MTLERDGEALLQFAAVYGFRNIQTLVHRMRKGRVPYQLVEVLSCPGGKPTSRPRWYSLNLVVSDRSLSSLVSAGCLSGRGQAESEVEGRVDKALVQQMEEVYSSLPVRLPELNPSLKTLYEDWLQGQNSAEASKLLHTEYRSPSQVHTQPPHMEW